MKPLLTLILGWIISGCSLEPAFTQPETVASHPVNLKSGLDDRRYSLLDIFRDDRALSQVLEHALVNNKDMQQSAVRIKAAYAQSWLTTTDLIPAVDMRLSHSSVMNSVNNPLTGGAVRTRSSSYQSSIGLDSYEVDIWGKTTAGIISDNYNVAAGENAEAAMRISLMAELASTWYETLSMIKSWHILNEKMSRLDALSVRLQILEKQDRINALTLSKFLRGKANDASSRANIEKEIMNRLYKLAYLSGYTSPGMNLSNWRTVAGDYTVPGVPQAITSAVIFNRPDIISAEMKIRAENGNIGAARSAFLPVVTIFSRAYHTSDSFNHIVGEMNNSWTLTPTVIIPIFSWPKAYVNLQLAKLKQEASVIDYRDTVAKALMDIQDSAGKVSIIHDMYTASELEYAAHCTNFDKIMLRYNSGYLDLYSLYESLDIFYTSRLNVESNHQAWMDSTIVLLKSIGV